LLKNNNKLYYLIVGESSGDLHAFHLMKAIKKLDPAITFRGIGGEKMKSLGLKSIAPFNRLAVMGFVEVLKDLLFFINLKKKIINDIKKFKPEKIILVDYPGFNLSLAKDLKKTLKIPIIYYISPQVWAWKESRVYKIEKYVDKLLVLFPFEVSWYKKRGVDVKYFGHPLIDINPKPKTSQKQPNTIALFPGSRDQEIKKHLPILKKTITYLKSINESFSFLLCLAPEVNIKKLKGFIDSTNVSVTTSSNEAFQKSSAAIIASGTATLEAAIAQTPTVVIYKTSIISWIIAKYFLSLKFVSMVNILANKEVFKELLQRDAQPEKIANEVVLSLKNSEEIINKLSKITKNLGQGSAYSQAAQFIIKYQHYVYKN
tara:strand:- start:38126 stop:39244 length:1119 start_codon:yes stop_codon:yes gene_type:complete